MHELSKALSLTAFNLMYYSFNCRVSLQIIDVVAIFKAFGRAKLGRSNIIVVNNGSLVVFSQVTNKLRLLCLIMYSRCTCMWV
jgi:hypothetical protein